MNRGFSDSIRVVSHRGRGYGHGDCSLRGIREALHSNVEGVLLDARLTGDLKWVVPLKNDAFTIEKIHSRPYYKIKDLVLDLDPVLALFSTFGKRKRLFLDLRDCGELRVLRKMLESYDLLDATAIVTWHHEDLGSIHDEMPTVSLGICLPQPRDAKTTIHKYGRRGKILLRYDKNSTYDAWLGIRPSERVVPALPSVPIDFVLAPKLMCTQHLAKLVHDRGAEILAYTVNRKMVASLFKRGGIDGIITESPR